MPKEKSYDHKLDELVNDMSIKINKFVKDILKDMADKYEENIFELKDALDKSQQEGDRFKEFFRSISNVTDNFKEKTGE